MEKASFLMYLDYEEQFNIMTDEQIGQLMRAIIKYEKTGEAPNLDGMLKMASLGTVGQHNFRKI